jgi:hypothetical protein
MVRDRLFVCLMRFFSYLLLLMLNLEMIITIPIDDHCIVQCQAKRAEREKTKDE